MTSWHTQAEVDAVVAERVTAQLARQIASYSGSPQEAKEILRGLAAARMMELDLRPFEDALVERHRQLDLSAA